MERISRFRAHILLLVFLLIMGFYAFYLYDIQIIETGGVVDNTDTFTTLTRIKAARGDILDKNGNVLVSNRASYDLVMNHYVILSANNTNGHLYNLAMACKEQGITYEDHFPISAERPFTYTLDSQTFVWQDHFRSFLAYMDDLDSDVTAPLLIEKLRERYEFPPEWTDEEARMVIGLRYEMSLRNCVPSLSNYVFVTDASDEELSSILELNIPGMSVEPSTVREYHTTHAAHILGYIGSMNAEQWEYYKTVGGYEMDAEIGLAGLEAAYEEYLHGVDGWRQDVVTADGTLVSSTYLQEPKAGSNVEVSLDMSLQIACEKALEDMILSLRAKPVGESGQDAQGGSAVVINVKTGQILACANYPSYDPAKFFEDYEELSSDPYKPLFNRALLGIYPPGSTYKISMVIAGFQDGLLAPDTKIKDQGVYAKYPGFNPTCLAYSAGHGSTHGVLTPSEAIRASCNYFFYDVGDRIRMSTMDNTAKALGLGEPTGVELEENIGHRSNPETKEMLYTGGGKEWFAADKILTAIGQSDNRFTPLQLCVYASTLANKGTRLKATFMNRVVSADYQSLLEKSSPVVMDQIDVSDECYNTYLQGMKEVCYSPKGTGYDQFLTYEYRFDVAAKTGTAEEVPNASANGAFICFFPADDPQIAISVYVERGGHGNVMGYVAQDIILDYAAVDEEGNDVSTYENRLS